MKIDPIEKKLRVSKLEPTQRTVGFLEAILRSTPNGIAVTDASQNIVLANARFCSYFRQHWRDVIETNLFVWIEQLDENAPDIWTKLVESVYRDGYCNDIDFKMSTSKGIQHISVNASLLEQDPAEEQGIIVSIWRDITRQKQLEEEIVASERFAVLGKLSGGIAHEIRNPLSVIDSSAYFLKRRLKDADQKTSEHLDRINKQVKVSTEIIEGLLDLAELKEPDKSRTDIIGILEDGIEISNIPHEVKIIKQIPEGEIFVEVDARQMSIVFRNVLTNAVQAMNDNGTIFINIDKSDNEGVRVSIKDTGPGIKKEDIHKVFQSFYGTKISGFGFGLTISKMIMERNGGKIEVQSELGKGATFTLYLPSAESNKGVNHEYKKEDSRCG